MPAFLPERPLGFPKTQGVLVGLAGLKDCAPSPRATTEFPGKGFPSLLTSSGVLERGEDVESPLSEAWFFHQKKYLILAQCDPGVWGGAWDEAWPGLRVLLFPPALVGHPQTEGRPHALCPRPRASACSAPAPGPAGPGRVEEGIEEVSFSHAKQKAAKRRPWSPGGGVEAPRWYQRY